MNRNIATNFARNELDKHGLSKWGIRLNTNDTVSFLGLCSHKDKCLILSAHHIDIHPDDEIKDTILHEIAHALTPGHSHDDVWRDKCREIGARPIECSYLDLPAHIIDAIRSGANVEMEIEEHVIKTPKFKVTRLQDKCPDCGVVAKEKFAITTVDKDGNTIKLITLECFHILKKIIPRGTPFEKMVSNDWKDEVKNCFHKWNKNQCEFCGEFKLFNFQVVGAKFAENALSIQKGAGIFDDMGLGKTVQALAILKYHSDKYCPAMIVTKSAIKFQWFKQVIRWLGPSYMAQVISTGKDYVFPNLKTYIIPYDLLRRFPQEKLAKLGIKLVILDECQQVKNPDSTRTQEVRKLIGGECKVLPLSGTPWKNRGSEFFPALNMIDPIKFYSYQHYLDNWVGYYYDGNKRKMGGIKNPSKFREFTASLLIRREYNEVMDEFPDINRMKLTVQLDELSQNTYDESVSDFVEWYNQYVIGGEEDNISSIEILAKMARMRHITGLAKIPATLTFIEQFIEETDRKLVIFVHHKDVGELMYSALINTSDERSEWNDLAKELKNNGYKVLKYTSELSDSDRFVMQEEFNKCDKAILIASTLACGEGVDLQTCADCIMHERQWNPQNEDQAAPGRFRRIGQLAKQINITVPEGEETIDQQLDEIVERKRRQFHEVMNKGEQPVWNEGELAKQLAESIVAKHRIKNKGVKSNITALASGI